MILGPLLVKKRFYEPSATQQCNGCQFRRFAVLHSRTKVRQTLPDYVWAVLLSVDGENVIGTNPETGAAEEDRKPSED